VHAGDRAGGARGAASSPIWTPPRWLAAVAGVPETCAKVIPDTGAATGWTRYERPDVTGVENCDAVVGDTTTVVSSDPSTTSTLWPGRGLRILIAAVDPALMAGAAVHQRLLPLRRAVGWDTDTGTGG
jgi:hypothetical protein